MVVPNENEKVSMRNPNPQPEFLALLHSPWRSVMQLGNDKFTVIAEDEEGRRMLIASDLDKDVADHIIECHTRCEHLDEEDGVNHG